MRITASGQTDVGRQRDHNEDACLIDTDLGLYIVCDGMGGHAAGEIASQETVRLVQASLRRQRAILSDYINSPTFEQRTQVLRLVEGAVQEACAHVYAMGQSDPMKKGMGTTIAMLLTLGEAAVIAHAGDSRVYLIRDHQAHQLDRARRPRHDPRPQRGNVRPLQGRVVERHRRGDCCAWGSAGNGRSGAGQ